MKRPLRLLPVLLVAPLLTSCFSASSSKGGDDQRLRAALAFPPAQGMSPYGDDAVTLSRLAVIEGLTSLDAEGKATPALAESWEAKSPTSWTLKLRQAVFQDGAPVDAAAVANALDRAKAAKPRPRVLSGVELTAVADDPRTVTVTTKEPDPLLPQRLANPTLAILSPAAYAPDGKVTTAGHATGPFTLTSLEGAAKATLERNKKYWGTKAQARGVDVTFTADGTSRANSLRTGQLDVAEYVPVSQAKSLPAGTVREVKTVRTNSLYLNTKSGLMADPAMRAAVRTSIDHKALVDGVYEGRADLPEGLLGPAVPWASGKRQAPQGRPEPADPRGKEMVLATYTNRPELPEVAAVVQQQLEKAGFTVRLEVREYARIEADALAGKFDAFIIARSTLLDTGDPVSYLRSDFTCDGSFNIAQLCDPKVDTAVAEASAIGDIEARRTAVMKAESLILGDDAVVPLLHERFVQGVADGVEDVRLDPYERTLIAAATHRK